MSTICNDGGLYTVSGLGHLVDKVFHGGFVSGFYMFMLWLRGSEVWGL